MLLPANAAVVSSKLYVIPVELLAVVVVVTVYISHDSGVADDVVKCHVVELNPGPRRLHKPDASSFRR